MLCTQRNQLDCPPPNGSNNYLPLNKIGAHSTGERFCRATLALLFYCVFTCTRQFHMKFNLYPTLGPICIFVDLTFSLVVMPHCDEYLLYSLFIGQSAHVLITSFIKLAFISGFYFHNNLTISAIIGNAMFLRWRNN